MPLVSNGYFSSICTVLRIKLSTSTTIIDLNCSGDGRELLFSDTFQNAITAAYQSCKNANCMQLKATG